MIIIKSEYEIEKLRASNRIVAGAFKKIISYVKEGVTTLELDEIAENYLIEHGATPAFKGYRGFPNTLCISVGCEVVHGIPSKRRLVNGDIVSIDLGSFYEGYYGDAAVTIPVGKISKRAKHLISITKRALMAAIEQAVPGNHLSDISHAVQCLVEKEGFSVVRDFVGHGIGTSLHEEPQIPNFGPCGEGPILRRGMVLAIEPMVNIGTYEVYVLSDNWTVVTKDKELSAHFEHSVVITDDGPEILSAI